jgi:Glycosyl transferase family 2
VRRPGDVAAPRARQRDGPSTGAAGAAVRKLSVSVVLPCLDEAASVGLAVERARRALAEAGADGEVIVVDNGSIDDSSRVAAAAGALVVHEGHRGYGSALRAGFAAARGDILVMADADLTYDLAKLPELVAPITDGTADVVLGSRLSAATRRTMPRMHRYLGAPVITYLTARACGGRVVRDSQSGFRAVRRDVVEELGLRSVGTELATEMLVRAARAGLRIAEVDVGHAERTGESKASTWSHGWRDLRLVLLLAPGLLLVGPGAALFGLGVVVIGGSFAHPHRVEIGSLRWQPVFLAGIALVLGLQALLAGAVLAHQSSIASPAARRRFAFMGHPRLPDRCLLLGICTGIAGLGVTVVLFVRWMGGEATSSGRSHGLASLSQALIIVGATLVCFGVISRFVSRSLTDARGP